MVDQPPVEVKVFKNGDYIVTVGAIPQDDEKANAPSASAPPLNQEHTQVTWMLRVAQLINALSDFLRVIFRS